VSDVVVHRVDSVQVLRDARAEVSRLITLLLSMQDNADIVQTPTLRTTAYQNLSEEQFAIH
jgi:hypothetical protein